MSMGNARVDTCKKCGRALIKIERAASGGEIGYCKGCKRWRAMTPDARREALERQRRAETLDVRDLRLMLGGGTAAVVGAVVLSVYLLVFVPMGRYDDAVGLMQMGSYAPAREAFAAMGDYRDANQRVAACDVLAALQTGDTAPLCKLLANMDVGDGSALSTMLRDTVISTLIDWQTQGIAAGDALAVLAFEDALDPEGNRGLEDLGVQIQLSMTGEDARMHMRLDTDADLQDELVLLTAQGDIVAYSMTQTGPQEKALSSASCAACLIAFAEMAEAQNDSETAMNCAFAAVKEMRSDGAIALLDRVAQDWAKEQQDAGNLQGAAGTLRELNRLIGSKERFNAYYDMQKRYVGSLDSEAAFVSWSSFCDEEAPGLETFGMLQQALRALGDMRLNYACVLAARGDGACLEELRQAAAEGADVKEKLPDLIEQYPDGLTKTMLRLLQAELAKNDGSAGKLRAQAGEEAVRMLSERRVNGMNGQDALRLILLCEREQLNLDGVDMTSIWREAMTEAAAEWNLTGQIFVSWNNSAHEELLGVNASGSVVLLAMVEDGLTESTRVDTGIENAQISILRDETHMVLATDGMTSFAVFACGSNGVKTFVQETGLSQIANDGQTISYEKPLNGSIPRSSNWVYAIDAQGAPECTGIEWGREQYPYPASDEQLITRWFEAHAYGIEEEKRLLFAEAADVQAGRSLELTETLPVPDDPAALEAVMYQSANGLSRWLVGYTSGGASVNVHVSCSTQTINGTDRHMLAGMSYSLGVAANGVGDESVPLIPFGEQVKARLASRSDMHTYRLLLPSPAQVRMHWQAGNSSQKITAFEIRLFTQEDMVNPYLKWQVEPQAATQASPVFYLKPGVYYAQVLPVRYKDIDYTLSFIAEDESHAEQEPNNTVTQATVIGLNEAFFGTLQTTKNSSMQTADDVDLYAFTLTETACVSLQLEQREQMSGSAQRLVISLHGGDDGQQIASASISGGSLKAQTPIAYLNPGNYYALVRKGTSWYRGVYSLTVSASDADHCETEPNNTMEQADQIQTNTPVSASFAQTGDTDVFAFTLTEDALVQPVMSFAPLSSSSRAYTIKLFSEREQLLNTGISCKETQKVIKPLVLPAGNYFVQTVNTGSEESGSAQPYTLQVTQAHINAAEREPNDSASTATPVGLGETVTGYAATEKDEDWFALTLNEKKSVIMRISVDGAESGNRIFNVYGVEKGETYLNKSVGVAGLEVELLVPQGTHYFRMKPISETMAWYTIEFVEK